MNNMNKRCILIDINDPSYLDYPSPPGDGPVRQGSRRAGSPAQLKC